MASLHRWSYPLNCPNCQTTGRANVAEDSGPPFGDLPTRSYTISDGFKVRPASTASASALVECAVCGALAD